MFLRNWPYAFSLLSATDGSSKVNGKFAVAPLPGLKGQGASSLGGHSIAISKFSDHKQTAFDFLKFYESEDTQKFLVQKASVAPVLASLYDDADAEGAVPVPARPVRPRSARRAASGHAVLPGRHAGDRAEHLRRIKGDKTTDQALSDLQAALKSAIGS